MDPRLRCLAVPLPFKLYLYLYHKDKLNMVNLCLKQYMSFTNLKARVGGSTVLARLNCGPSLDVEHKLI